MEEQNLSSGNLNPTATNQGFIDSLKPKTAFLAGLIGGFLLICTIGFFILLAMMLSNDSTSAAGKVNANSNINAGNVANTNNAVAPQYGKPAAVNKDDHKQGQDNAKLVMIEYSDFQCPFCQKHHETMKKIVQDFGDKVQWVFRNFPLTQIHPFANKAALAAECASEQGKFWEYADKLFENQSKFSDTYFGELANELKLNTNQFNTCVSSAKYQGKIDAQTADGQQAGARGTPATFLNGQLVPGAVPYDQFKSQVEGLLK